MSKALEVAEATEVRVRWPAEAFAVLQRKYVRVLGERLLADGGKLIEFEFAIGDPTLAIELILAEPDFRQFCARQQVQMLGEPAPAAGDDPAAQAWQWSPRAVTESLADR